MNQDVKPGFKPVFDRIIFGFLPLRLFKSFHFRGPPDLEPRHKAGPSSGLLLEQRGPPQLDPSRPDAPCHRNSPADAPPRLQIPGEGGGLGLCSPLTTLSWGGCSSAPFTSTVDVDAIKVRFLSTFRKKSEFSHKLNNYLKIKQGGTG